MDPIESGGNDLSEDSDDWLLVQNGLVPEAKNELVSEATMAVRIQTSFRGFLSRRRQPRVTASAETRAAGLLQPSRYSSRSRSSTLLGVVTLIASQVLRTHLSQHLAGPSTSPAGAIALYTNAHGPELRLVRVRGKTNFLPDAHQFGLFSTHTMLQNVQPLLFPGAKSSALTVWPMWSADVRDTSMSPLLELLCCIAICCVMALLARANRTIAAPCAKALPAFPVKRMNVNDASIAELKRVDLVGSVLAKRILSSCPFDSSNFEAQLVAIKGIGKVRAAKVMKSYYAEDPHAKRVNINKAGIEELRTIDLVGSVLAERIISSRPFGVRTLKAQLLGIRGIGQKKASKLIESLYVEE